MKMKKCKKEERIIKRVKIKVKGNGDIIKKF